ncbi:scamp family-domain-containing protein [Polychytrium aggregatum]|uniref:scamp family-domain-containing protein n=1 Tax=Polychytrium aggregatum TaxID=110093 RepID=UPI0022FE9180|nr:scamp family-domain-containing protein [Polychytrium aggregatum]KAI9206298.1 scamp family-domain-containing protein [Polychytrium aggregatum]
MHPNEAARVPLPPSRRPTPSVPVQVGGGDAGATTSEYKYSASYDTKEGFSDSQWASRAPAFTPPPAKSQKEIELEQRELAIKYREDKLKEREEKMVDFHAPNWPPFRPIIYHDIEKDIPQRGKPLVKRLYAAWMIATATYLMNCIASFSILVTKGESGGGTFGLSLIILLVGTPVSFVFWYRPLYTGVKADRSISFFLFFFNYSFHLAFAALLAVGIPGWGGAGVIYTLSQMGNNLPSGILCAISSAFLIGEVVYGLWQIKTVSAFYRSRGLTMEQAQREAVAGVASSQVGQEFAKQAVKGTLANVV